MKFNFVSFNDSIMRKFYSIYKKGTSAGTCTSTSNFNFVSLCSPSYKSFLFFISINKEKLVPVPVPTH
jgi:hypothetical protein